MNQGRRLILNLSFTNAQWNQRVFTSVGLRHWLCIAILARKKQKENDLEVEITEYYNMIEKLMKMSNTGYKLSG